MTEQATQLSKVRDRVVLLMAKSTLKNAHVRLFMKVLVMIIMMSHGSVACLAESKNQEMQPGKFKSWWEKHLF